VLLFLGKYTGTVRTAGFWWVNPLASKELVSLRVRNFNSDRLKVNDAGGNPIEIAAVVVWRVVDSAKALFDVDYYEEFVAIQSETAIRSLAICYPYDSGEDDRASLRGSPDEVNTALQQQVQDRLQVAGVEVLETRLSHLAYAPEIAQVMLRRQQAQAIIAARQQIVEGAVSMVEMAMNQLSDRQIIALDDDRKAKMINNLLVVLTSENNIQPVVNAGQYQDG
jgi:regulator of protease activity HflC (stomatin/prohibitin superfamily)